MITCSINGVPRTIHIKVLIVYFKGLNELIAPKATISPSGRARTNVNKKIKQVVPKPCKRSNVTSKNIAYLKYFDESASYVPSALQILMKRSNAFAKPASLFLNETPNSSSSKPTSTKVSDA